MKLKKSETKWDFLWTHDLRSLLSPLLVSFLARNSNTTFEVFPVNTDGFAYIDPEIALTVDHVASRSQKIKLCMACGQYQDLVAATRPLIVTESDIDDYGIYKTDVALGSGQNKGAILIVGQELRNEIIKAEFSGVYFDLVSTMN